MTRRYNYLFAVPLVSMLVVAPAERSVAQDRSICCCDVFEGTTVLFMGTVRLNQHAGWTHDWWIAVAADNGYVIRRDP